MKASNTLLVIPLLLAVASGSFALDTRYLQGLGDSGYERIDSEILGRSLHIYIKLPDGYADNPERRYPTIYLLDGGALFPLLAAYSRYLNFGEEIPDVIIVGISYGSATFEGGNLRSTDYTAASSERDYYGGAPNFQRFLDEELLPRIEADYRARADRRVIFGQSLGGQFVLYTALTRPDLFWGHIASNPALHRNLPFFLQKAGKTRPGSETPKLFVANGTLNDEQFRVPALAWIEHWTAQSDTPWELETVSLDGHTHMSTPPAAFRAGMAWVFERD